MFTRTVEQNKALVEKHPYIKPRNVWTGKEIEDYDYTWTLLDAMPYGWNKAFGEQLLEELTEALNKYSDTFKNEYFVTQIKEKYGSLRWYDNGINAEADEVITKYRKLSSITCIQCGKPATKISGGWISPYCDKHIGDRPVDYIIENGEMKLIE